MLGTRKRQNQPVTPLLQVRIAVLSCVCYRFLCFHARAHSLENFVGTKLK